MTIWLRLLPYAATVLLGFFLGHLVYRGEIAVLESRFAEERRALTEARVNALVAAQSERRKLEQVIDKLNRETIEELLDAQDENARLRREYSGLVDEHKRLRIRIDACATNLVSATAGSGSLDHATYAELHRDAGLAVWDLRGTLIMKEAQLAYLQRYVCSIHPELTGCTP